MSLTYHNGFQARMASGKRQAQSARNRGLSGGKQGWRVYKPAPVDEASFTHLVDRTRHAWDCQAGLAVEDYLRAVFPERYEVFE